MRKIVLVTSALIVSLSVLGLSAHATPITVDLQQAAGSSSYNFNLGSHGSLTLSGWENDNKAWVPASMTYKADGPNETGLGVACNPGFKGAKCSQDEINSQPWQIVAVNLSALTGYNQLSIGVGSVDGAGGNGLPETAFLFGATCLFSSGAPGTPCVLSLLGSYTYSGSQRTHSFDFTRTDLSGLTSIWVTPFFTGDPAKQGNVLLSSLSLSVPEPAVLGIFVLGILLVGLFTGLRKPKI